MPKLESNPFLEPGNRKKARGLYCYYSATNRFAAETGIILNSYCSEVIQIATKKIIPI
jgi:hypothetical protein